MQKHLLNELKFVLIFKSVHPFYGEGEHEVERYNVYRPFLNKDDSISFLYWGSCSSLAGSKERYLKKYEKECAPWFEFQLRLRDLRILIKQEFSKLFKKEKNK